MSNFIPGLTLRDSILRKLANPPDTTVEQVRIETLAIEENRKLLEAIGRLKPRSISELSAKLADQQPDISRSLLALARANLVELVADGRATLPRLTAVGAKMAEALKCATIDR